MRTVRCARRAVRHAFRRDARKTAVRAAAVTILPLFAAACGALPWNPQGSAGLTRAEVKWCESEKDGADRYLCAAEIIDGKEKSDVKLTVKLPGGTEVDYQAKDVKAFRAHEVRSAVEEAVSEDVKSVAPGIVDSIVKAITGL